MSDNDEIFEFIAHLVSRMSPFQQAVFVAMQLEQHGLSLYNTLTLPLPAGVSENDRRAKARDFFELASADILQWLGLDTTVIASRR